MPLLYPEWDRPCKACETHLYREDGTLARDRRTGLPMLRPAGSPTPCHKCPKVPLSLRQSGAELGIMRANAAELTPQHRRAWKFYRECRAVGDFPDDPLVRWYSALFREAEDVAARAPLDRLADGIGGLLALLTRRR